MLVCVALDDNIISQTPLVLSAISSNYLIRYVFPGPTYFFLNTFDQMKALIIVELRAKRLGIYLNTWHVVRCSSDNPIFIILNSILRVIEFVFIKYIFFLSPLRFISIV